MKAKLVNVVKETSTTNRFYLKPESKPIFKPGQFVSLDLPIDEKTTRRIRHYSVANSPSQDTYELIIVKKPGGKGTDYLWNLPLETEIEFEGPTGIMVMGDDIKKNYIFICTGTGISPFKCMLEHIRENNIVTGDIHLVFGTRDKESILYYDEMIQLEKDIPQFKYHIILSREPWNGKQGYVHSIYEELVQNYFSQIEDGSYNGLDIEFFICGWKEMVKQTKTNLQELGFDKKQIKIEIYE
jgi:CDP-4-dehydro-6-deoxyglucose reductase